jgi:hypothetical protein
MEYLRGSYNGDEGPRLSLLDSTNVAWPDRPQTVEDVRKLGASLGVIRVRNIRIRLETRPAGQAGEKGHASR